jgi:ribosome-binding protein aMBF1 (putative translation factor)
MVPKCTQKALAEKCSVKLQEIASFEGGKVLPNPQQTGTLERILKVHLTGANIGDEIERFKKGDAKMPVTKTADPKAATKTSAK